MEWIICTVAFIGIMVVTVTLMMYFVLKKDTSKNESSKYILNKFEPDNTSPMLTEMIDFHKKNKSIKYKID